MKIRIGFQYVGYFHYSKHLNWATQNLRLGHGLDIADLNLHTKGYLAESLRVVLFCLCFSSFTSTISQKLLYFTLLHLLMILIFICQSLAYVLQTTVNLELCKIDNWLRANKLSLNYSKTKFYATKFSKTQSYFI